MFGAFAEDAGVVAGDDFDELGEDDVPAFEQVLGVGAAGAIGVRVDDFFEHVLVVVVLDGFEVDHGGVDVGGEGAVFVPDVGEAAAHAGGEVASGGAEDDDGAAGHVFAAVVADAFDDSASARVADGEALAGAAGDPEAAAGRAVEDGVADDDGVFADVAGALGRGDGDHAAAHALADVVVGFAAEVEAEAACEECAEGLAGGAVEVEFEGAGLHAAVAVALGDFAGDACADGAVLVGDFVGFGEVAAGLDAVFEVVEDLVVEAEVVGAVVAGLFALAGEPGVGFDGGEEAGEVDGAGAFGVDAAGARGARFG